MNDPFQAYLIEILPGSERLTKLSPYTLSPASPAPFFGLKLPAVATRVKRPWDQQVLQTEGWTE